eukprot:c4746_g1_i1 orf=1-318(-)
MRNTWWNCLKKLPVDDPIKILLELAHRLLQITHLSSVGCSAVIAISGEFQKLGQQDHKVLDRTVLKKVLLLSRIAAYLKITDKILRNSMSLWVLPSTSLSALSLSL